MHLSKQCYVCNFVFAWRSAPPLINSLGQIAGFISPFLVGCFKDRTGSTDLALYILSAVLVLGAMLVMRVPAKVVNR